MTRLHGLILGGFCAILAVLALSSYYLARPTFLRIAVGPDGTETNRIVAAVQQVQMRDRSPIRIVPVVRETQQDISTSLATGDVDLAIIRSDTPFPLAAQVVAIWQRNPLMLVTRKESGVQRWTDLKDRRVAIVGRAQFNTSLFQQVLRQNDVNPQSVFDVAATPQNCAEMLHSGSVDAVFIVGPTSARHVRDSMNQLRRVLGVEQLQMIAIKESEAIAAKVNALEQVDIVTGTFSINPPFPDATVETLQVSHFLVASRDLSEATVSELTEQLFLQRRALSASEEGVSRIEAADTERGAAFPVHPGAQAYYDGTQKTFLERYSDLIYLGIFGLSLGGSGVAAIATYASSINRRKNRIYLRDIVHLVRVAREAQDGDTLDKVSVHADELFTDAIERSSDGQFDSTEFASVSMALDHLRSVIADRRRALTLEVMAYESDYFEDEPDAAGKA